MSLLEILSAVSTASSLVGGLIALMVRSVVTTWRIEAQRERETDKDEMRNWIETRFLPAREADGRIRSLETRGDDHEQRLRRMEMRRRNRNVYANRPD